MLKLKLLIITIVAILLLLPSLVTAQPSVCGFYGSVALDGDFAPTGATVKAWIEGNVVKSVPTTSGARYNMYIDGTFDGKTVSFTVGPNDAPASQTRTWEGGENTMLNLTALTAPAGPAEITLDESEGFATTISGSGFTASSTVTIKWDGVTISSIPPTVTVSAGGAFTAGVLAPQDAIAGSHVITASDAGGKSAEADFTVPATSAEETPTPTPEPEVTQGLQGEDGPQGPQGEQGLQGPQGPAGESDGSTLAIIAIAVAIVSAGLAIFSLVKGSSSKAPIIRM